MNGGSEQGQASRSVQERSLPQWMQVVHVKIAPCHQLYAALYLAEFLTSRALLRLLQKHEWG